MFTSTLRSLHLFCIVGLTATVFGQSAQDATQNALPAEDWAGIRAAYEESRHSVYAVEGGYQARNSGQQWTASFDGRAFSVLPDGGSWTWGLQLERYGFAGSERELTNPADMSADGGRVTYKWNEALEEWYINDQRGLEHGFTVTERPVTDEQGGASPLTFTFSIRGPLRPEVNADARGVDFSDGRGATSLTYTGLCVADAGGQKLEASFERVGDKLLLTVDERGARYPLTIDPLVQQQAYLQASNAQGGDVFGWSVSVSGDTIVVGATHEDSKATGVDGNQNDNSLARAGAAYVFVRNGTSWSQQAYLKASNTDAHDQFGTSVSISGDTVVVGAFWEASQATGVNGDQSDNSSPKSGAAYVFVRSGTTWSQQAYLKARNSGKGDRFGISVALSGNTVVVGAPSEDSNATVVNGNGGNNSALQAGAAYVFARDGTTWNQQAYLKASNTEANDRFGFSVSVSGDTVAVTAGGEDSNATGVNGDQSNNSAMDSGATYVFVRSGTSWSQQAYLKATNAETGDAQDYFYLHGLRAAVSGDTLVVGAVGEDSNATGVNGDQNNNSAISSGAAYVFVRSGTSWSQHAYLKASNTEAYDLFGHSVSVSGNTVIIGATHERSSSTGVNGNQNDNNVLQAGATYMFVRSGTSWAQRAYIKAFNTGQAHEFGHAVSVSGDTVVVAARNEFAHVFATDLPVMYCTGKSTSAGCMPFMSWSGVPSATAGPFQLISENHVQGGSSILLYSFQKAQLGFHGGTLCVKSPFRRLTSLIKVTDGLACTGCAGNCRMFKRNFNELIQTGTDPMLTPGQNVHVQVRQLDPGNLGPTGFADNLSDALAFTVGP